MPSMMWHLVCQWPLWPPWLKIYAVIFQFWFSALDTVWSFCVLVQGSSTSRLQPTAGPWPIWNQAAWDVCTCVHSSTCASQAVCACLWAPASHSHNLSCTHTPAQPLPPSWASKPQSLGVDILLYDLLYHINYPLFSLSTSVKSGMWWAKT